MSQASTFSSVKLSGALILSARESAATSCRSTSGQIEYWALLGRSVEEAGLTTIEAQSAISGRDSAGVHSGRKLAASSLTDKILNANTTGSLAQRVRDVVQANRLAA
jgi:ParD-like antitoxin of type II bacterial toxin-antitoxin system